MSNMEVMVSRYKDVTVVDLGAASVLDATTIDAFGRSLLELVQVQDNRKIVLDFANVRFMSSQALGVLLQLKRAMDPLKGRVIISGIKPELHRVFKITNLHKLFTFTDQLDDALAQFNVYIPKS